MKIDFHTHVKLAKKLPFSPKYTDWLFKEARAAGLDAICITEHFNTLGFDEVYQYIAGNYPREEDTFLINGLRLFPGMEIDIAEGGHILALGTMEDILALNHELTPYKEKGHFLAFEKLLVKAHNLNVYLGAGHPFREGSAIPSLPSYLLKQLHFIDLNGKDYAQKGKQAQEEIRNFATELHLPIVTGSDTHQAFQYASIYMDITQEITTVKGLIEAIQTPETTIHIHKDIAFKVNAASTLKKTLKEIHALGGDYVRILTEE